MRVYRYVDAVLNINIAGRLGSHKKAAAGNKNDALQRLHFVAERRKRLRRAARLALRPFSGKRVVLDTGGLSPFTKYPVIQPILHRNEVGLIGPGSIDGSPNRYPQRGHQKQRPSDWPHRNAEQSEARPAHCRRAGSHGYAIRRDTGDHRGKA